MIQVFKGLKTSVVVVSKEKLVVSTRFLECKIFIADIMANI